MNKWLFLLFTLLISSGLRAQYTKVSYFGKEGRVFNVGSTAHFIGDGKGTPIGFHFGAGLDKPVKRLISWYELEVIPPFKYSYQTNATDMNTFTTVPITVSGKSNLHILSNYNFGYHFLDRSENEPRLQPFVFLGINLVLRGRAEEPYYGEVQDVEKPVSQEGYNFGFRGGLGLTVKLSDMLQIRTLGGYNWHYDSDKTSYNGGEVYNLYTSNVQISAGLQIRIP